MEQILDAEEQAVQSHCSYLAKAVHWVDQQAHLLDLLEVLLTVVMGSVVAVVALAAIAILVAAVCEVLHIHPMGRKRQLVTQF